MSVTARPSPDLTAEPTAETAPTAATTGRPRRNLPPDIGRSFLAAAAVLAGASSLASAVSGSSWVLALIEVVAVIWLVGVGGRLTQLPAAGTVVLQVAAFLIALTSLFTTGGIGGVLPGGAALAQARTLFGDALAQVAGTSPPTPSTPALSLLIALTVGCAALAADIFITLAKSPALVGLPLLCLYSVPVSILDAMLPWYAFAAPAVLYIALLSLPKHGRQGGARIFAGRVLPGFAITALALAAALTVAGSMTIIGTGGRLPHTASASSGVALSPFASLQGSLKSSTAVNVLTATGLAAPDYFRTVALTTWTANRGWSLGQVRADISSRGGSLTPAALRPGSPVTVTAQNLRDRFLPILPGTSAITGLADKWSYDSALGTVFRPDPVNPGRYLLTVDQAKPGRSALQADTVVIDSDLTDTGPLSPLVQATAQQVTAAQAGPFDKAAALQQWFTDPANGFTYSLDVPAQDTDDALVNFLTHKQGYCQQYASAMAIMLRSLHIPARVVIGYTQGIRRSDGSYLVTSRNAHAWVEVKFLGNGWVRFDPTPAVNGQGGQQGFTDNAPTPATTPARATPTVPAAAPRLPLENPKLPAMPTAAAANTGSSPAADHGSGSAWTRIALLTLLEVAVLAGVLAAPTTLRRRRRRLRLTIAAGGGEKAAAAAWHELEDTAIDHRLFPQPTESARAIANRIARRAQLPPTDRARLRQLVHDVETGWYSAPPTATGVSGFLADHQHGHAGVGTATLTMDAVPDHPNGEDLAAVVQGVVVGLRANVPLRWAERIFPHSLRGPDR